MGAICRDTRLIRWAIAQLETESPVRRDAYETAVVAKWNKFLFDYGVDTVISLDLHWLFTAKLFVDDPKVRHIHSLWLDDSQLQNAPMFSLAPASLLDFINGPKVSHHCRGEQRVGEMLKLGVKRVDGSFSVPLEDAGECDWEGCLRRILA